MAVCCYIRDNPEKFYAENPEGAEGIEGAEGPSNGEGGGGGGDGGGGSSVVGETDRSGGGGGGGGGESLGESVDSDNIAALRGFKAPEQEEPPPPPMDAWMDNGHGRTMLRERPGATMTLRRGPDGHVQLFPIADLVKDLLEEVQKDPEFLDKRRDELAAKFLEGRRMLEAADAAEKAAAVAAAAAVQRQHARRATPYATLRRDWTQPGAWVSDDSKT